VRVPENVKLPRPSPVKVSKSPPQPFGGQQPEIATLNTLDVYAPRSRGKIDVEPTVPKRKKPITPERGIPSIVSSEFGPDPRLYACDGGSPTPGNAQIWYSAPENVTPAKVTDMVPIDPVEV
jgi:hypothetical protein